MRRMDELPSTPAAAEPSPALPVANLPPRIGRADTRRRDGRTARSGVHRRSWYQPSAVVSSGSAAVARCVALLLLGLLLLAGTSVVGRAQEGQPAAPAPAANGAENGTGSAVAPNGAAPNAGATKPASQARGIPREPWEVLRGLGLFVYPLGITSIVVVWFSIERVIVLRSSRVIPQPFVNRFFDHIDEGNIDPRTAIKLCEENGSPIALVFAHGLRKWGKPSVEVEQAIIDGGERQVSLLRKHLRILNGASNVAPLIGLLGTVTGMIEAFGSLGAQQGSVRTEDLAAGIGLALLTTAAGLVIAIPSLIVYMFLAGRVDALVIQMDTLAQELVDAISAEGLADRATRQQRARPEPRKTAPAPA